MEELQQQPQNEDKKQDKKVQAENMRLKKYIYQLEKELDDLKRFIGGANL